MVVSYGVHVRWRHSASCIWCNNVDSHAGQSTSHRAPLFCMIINPMILIAMQTVIHNRGYGNFVRAQNLTTPSTNITNEWGWEGLKFWVSLTCTRVYSFYSTNSVRFCASLFKQWDLDYDSMLQLLNLPRLSVHRKYLKLTTMYNIVSGHMDFPSSIFVQSNLPYYLNRTSTFNFTRLFEHTNYMYHSYAPSVISLWNNLPDSVKVCSCISSSKRSLLYHFEAHVSH